jgi:hypothetical protein
MYHTIQNGKEGLSYGIQRNVHQVSRTKLTKNPIIKRLNESISYPLRTSIKNDSSLLIKPFRQYVIPIICSVIEKADLLNEETQPVSLRRNLYFFVLFLFFDLLVSEVLFLLLSLIFTLAYVVVFFVAMKTK